MSGRAPKSGRPGALQSSEAAASLVDRLVGASEDTVVAVLLYGSHLHKTSPDRHSAVDLVVVVDDYRAFYTAMAQSGELHRPSFALRALARVLPPNVLNFAPDEGRGGIAKYLLVSRAHLAAAVAPDAPDHFLLGRMVQRVGVVWTADGAAAEWIEAQLAMARAGVLRWVTPYMDEPVDADALGRLMLEVCYAGEFRPESTARAGRIFEAQAEHFRDVLGPVLEAAVAEGEMRRVGERFALSEPIDARHRRRVRRYFRRSKARTTARWIKHVVTFANWLPYIERKVERHTGRKVRLTKLERKLPLVFLWPRVVQVLLTRPEKELRP